MSIPEKNENKGAKAVERERRRVEVAQDLANGFTVRESAKNLGVSKDTIVKDRKAIMGRFQNQADESVSEYRAEVLVKLAEIEALVSDSSVDKVDKAKVLLDVVKQLRAVYGTDAPTKSISASFSANSDPLYLEFKKATAGLDEQQLYEVFGYAMRLPRTTEPIDATWFPKEENDDAS